VPKGLLLDLPHGSLWCQCGCFLCTATQLFKTFLQYSAFGPLRPYGGKWHHWYHKRQHHLWHFGFLTVSADVKSLDGTICLCGISVLTPKLMPIGCQNSLPLSPYCSRLRMAISCVCVCVCVLFLYSCKVVWDIKWCKILYLNDIFNDMTNNGISYPNFHSQMAFIQHLFTSSSEFSNWSCLSGTVDHLAHWLHTAASLS
jgi:hypothetical protein